MTTMECQKEIEVNENDLNSMSDLTFQLSLQELKRRIKPLIETLNDQSHSDEFDKIFGNSEKSLIDFSLLQRGEKFYGNLIYELKNRKNEAESLFLKLMDMNEKVMKNEDVQLGFTIADKSVLNAMKSLREAFERIEKMKSERIASYVEEIRIEIIRIWDSCKITPEDRAAFLALHSIDFTEKLLELHKLELGTWKVYQKKNQKLFDKLREREEMWTKFRDVQARSNDPAKFTNRGGALLKDQKEEKVLTKRIPKIEEELKTLAKEFEKEHGKKIKVDGLEIHEIIERDAAVHDSPKPKFSRTPKRAAESEVPDKRKFFKAASPVNKRAKVVPFQNIDEQF